MFYAVAKEMTSYVAGRETIGCMVDREMTG